MKGWLRTFRSGVLAGLPEGIRETVVDETTALLAPALARRGRELDRRLRAAALRGHLRWGRRSLTARMRGVLSHPFRDETVKPPAAGQTLADRSHKGSAFPPISR